MNYLWGCMILLGIVYSFFSGNIQGITDTILSSAREAVSLCISMAGILAFWNGLMEIAKESGLVSFITGLLEPIISFLFPDIPKNHPVREHLSTNMAANILGLGMAATPAGLKAMKELAKLNHKKSASPELASTEMCNFLILNISSLQLIPVNIIAYRSQYGSSYPSAIVGPGILATALSTAAGILFCKIAARFSHSPKS